MEALLCILLIGFVGIITWLIRSPAPQKILGVYSQPTRTYYIKVILFYLLLQLRKLQARWKQKEQGERSSGYGVQSKTKINLMECPQQLSDHPKAIDAVYFNAADRDGNYFVMATARRPKCVINGLLYIRIPQIGLLDLPKMPDTLLFGEGKGFQAEGLSITPIEPMKSWKLQYSGEMKMQNDASKRYNVQLQAIWYSKFKYFDFDSDMDPWCVAKCMARELWSKEYFEDLRRAHQTHYEQMGMLKGSVTIDGKEFNFHMNSMRDHSYGHKREWKLMHRYGLHMIHTKDGYSITVGIVCQPVTSSNLELGFVCTPSGEKIAVSCVDLPLWQHGEGGTAPVDYSFSFSAGNKNYIVEVDVIDRPEFFIGWEWETRVVEGMAKYRVNGVDGWGIAEWDYRHFGGRQEKYSHNDPAWTETLNKG